MIPSSYPEASRLVYRIRTAITGESTGLETAKLAWQQAEAVARANAGIGKALQAVDNGALLDALLIDLSFPHLLEAARSLDHSLTEAWKQRCESFGWRVADPIDSASAAKLQASIDEQGDLKDWLYTHYRTAIRSKDQSRAYQIIQLIASRFPDDENAKEEANAQQKTLVGKAAADLTDALEQLIPEQSPKEVVRSYFELGLPLADSQHDSITQILSEAAKERAKAHAEKVQQVIDMAKDSETGGDWKALEKAYLETDYALAVQEARGHLDPELREEFEKVATQLSRIRAQFESKISIRLAIEDLRNGRQHKGKPVPLANRLAKLKSLEAQTVKTGLQIESDVQAEIKAAYRFATLKRFPFYAGIAALVIIAFAGATYLSHLQTQKEELAATQAEALAELQATERLGDSSKVRSALAKWEEAISQAEPGSSLANEEELLIQWLEIQSSLENNYNAAIADLSKLASSEDSLENEEAVKVLAADIRKMRSDLAPDLGHEAEAQFVATLANYNQRRAQTLDADRSALALAEQELRVAASNAARANSRAEFERLRSAVDKRVSTIALLLERKSLADDRGRLLPVLKSAQDQMDKLEAKWGALDNSWIRLAETKELGPYLEQLERIHSFDILPADAKKDISQTLQLKDDFEEMKGSEAFIGNKAAENAFSSDQDYLSERASLSSEERLFVDRLKGLDVFANVYQSTVQYFEGAADPKNEYRIYLVEPISKSDSQDFDSHVAFTFSVHGFDEFGNPSPTPREIQFISREDGSFWGFFYKPSILSPESEYYNNSISNFLNILIAGTDRLAVIKQIKDLEEQTQLAPAYRVYWQKELIAFMRLNPWKWGLALSPALQKRETQLNALPSGVANDTLWLSTIEQTVPSPEYRLLVEQTLKTLPAKEVEALAGLYQNVRSGNYLLAGRVLPNAKPDLFRGVPNDTPLWTVNALTGSVERSDKIQSLVPYAPLVRFALADADSPSELLRKTISASGLKLNEAPYLPLLPALYQ